MFFFLHREFRFLSVLLSNGYYVRKSSWHCLEFALENLQTLLFFECVSFNFFFYVTYAWWIATELKRKKKCSYFCEKCFLNFMFNLIIIYLIFVCCSVSSLLSDAYRSFLLKIMKVKKKKPFSFNIKNVRREENDYNCVRFFQN